MIDEAEIFLLKAEESLDGAESELANGRYNNCANRCYYCCFQAAVSALIRAGIRPTERKIEWGHDFVQAQFVGQLINRRKRFAPSLRSVLAQQILLREKADYKAVDVSPLQAARALNRAREFVTAVRKSEGE